MIKESDSKGLSRVATIILIVLIILIIISFFIVKDIILKGSGERAIGKFTLNLKISQVQIINNNSLHVIVKRNIGKGNFTGINFILDDGYNTETIRTNTSLDELESKIFLLHFFIVNVSEAKKLSIDSIFNFESEKNFGKNIKDVYVFSSSNLEFSSCIPYCPEGAECGSNSCGGECASGCAESGYFCLDYKCLANLETKCLQTNIVIKEIRNIATNFSVTLSKQGEGGDIGGIIFVFTNESGYSNFVTDVPGNINSPDTVTKHITILESQLANPDKVRLIIYFLDGAQNQQFCPSSTWFKF